MVGSEVGLLVQLDLAQDFVASHMMRVNRQREIYVQSKFRQALVQESDVG